MKNIRESLDNSTDFLGFLSLGGVLLSGILLLSPARAVGYIGMGGSVGTFTAAVVSRKKHLQVVEQELNRLTSQHNAEVAAKDDSIVVQDAQIRELQGKLKQFGINASNHAAEVSNLQQMIEQLQGQVSRLTGENQAQNQTIEAYTNELKQAIALARSAVQESLDEWESRLRSLIETKRERYPKLSERLNDLLREGQGLIADYEAKLAETPSKWDSLGDLLSIYYCANDDLAAVKTKVIQAIAKLTNQETQLELKECEEILEEWESANLVPRDKLEHIIRNYEAALNEFRVEFSNRFDATHQFALALEGQTQDDDKFVQGIIAKMNELEAKIQQLSKPLKYVPATRADMKVANIIIEYFQRLGVILDRAGSDYKGYEAILEFLPDRTGRLVLPDELNEHSDKLQALAHTLNSPKFALDPESGLIRVTVQLAKKPKADAKDIERLWIPASQFEKTVKGWSRVRLTGGSESGKSPTAENLAVAILKHRPGVPKLYNPQFDSVKNYWTIPVLGTSHADSEKGISELAKQVDARANGQEPKGVFELSIFDEIDSTMSHTKGKKAVIGGNVNFIIKQASHQNLGAIFIGQNANVSEYPGMDRSDWNSAVNVHIGANAYDAIQNSNRFTSDEQSKLKATADKITEFCESKNEDLGLDKTDPNAYRFALVIEPNKKPYFIELPAFGTYTFDQCQQQRQTETAASHPVLANSQDACTVSISEGRDTSRHPGMSGMETRQDTSTKPTCPHCGSNNVRSKGDKWQCQNPEHSIVASDKPKSWKK